MENMAISDDDRKVIIYSDKSFEPKTHTDLSCRAPLALEGFFPYPSSEEEATTIAGQFWYFSTTIAGQCWYFSTTIIILSKLNSTDFKINIFTGVSTSKM